MNIEQKAKAYDEALDRAKKELQTCGSTDCDAARQIFRFFPELEESEDERIRKFLVDYFTSYKIGNVTTKLNGYRIDDIIAYLEKQKNLDKMIVVSPEVWDGAINDAYENGKKDSEKQKEQKPWKVGANAYFTPEQKSADLSEMMVHKEPYIAPVPTPMVADEQKPIVLSDKFEVALEEFLMNARDKSEKTFAEDVKEYADRLREIVINEKKEQKPTEWDDYTKTNLGRAIQIIKDARGTLHGYQTDDGIYECDKAIEALEHFLYRGLEIEKSAEWSEEDEKRFKRVLEIVDRHGTVPVFDGKVEKRFNAEYIWLKNLRERLKSFRPQSKQEQNDYITPHKEFFKFIYDRLINVHKENPNVDYMRSFKERLNNLSFGEKQEWSEEDEKMRNLIVAIFEVNHPDGFFKANELGTTDMRGVHTEEIVSWLKSLRPSWKQTWKPTEKEITALENLMKGEFPNKIFPGATLSELLNKLKKLYYNESIPSWKPSEEQMEALKDVIETVPMTCRQQIPLESLYADLQKLL